MMAKRLPTILPDLTFEEALEITKIHSIAGELLNNKPIIATRPFRAPHHTASGPAIIGGGRIPKPGEISLAHFGVLFLDELPEFNKNTLEVLRGPLEDKLVTISRVNGTLTYPANFLLLAAMNPCNCGYYPDMKKCRCSESGLRRYFDKVSQPLLDRIDICVEAPTLTYSEVAGKDKSESSKSIQKRVLECHQIQCERYKEERFFHNSHIPASRLEEFCHLGVKERHYMENIYLKLSLTARTYHKILRVARTIADLEQSNCIQIRHLKEAVCYRSADKKFWGGGSL